MIDNLKFEINQVITLDTKKNDKATLVQSTLN